MKWLKHAFAVEPEAAAVPDAAQSAVIEKLCAEVVRRRLVTPALMFLEMSRPLNYVSAQFLHFLQPLLTVVTDAAGYQAFAGFLEQRGSIEYILRRLETLNSGLPATPHATD